MGTKATLDGTDVTASLRDRGVSWGPRDLATHVDVGSVLLRGTSPVIPDDDMVLEITDTDGLTKVFGGVVRMPDAEETIGDGGAELTYQVRAQGWAALLYRIPITTTKAYAAGVSDAYIVRDLLAAYYGPIATSVTHVVRSSRVDMPAMTFVAGQLSLGQALDQIAVEANGASWWIDPADKAVHWNDTDRRAPFLIVTSGADVRDGYRREVLADKPVAYYRLGETSGTVATDASGNGRDGTYVGGYTQGSAGAVDDSDAAVSFNGSTGAVSVADNAALRPAEISVECWYNRDVGLVGPNGEIIVKKSTDGNLNDGYGVFLRSGLIQFYVNNYGSATTFAAPAGRAWHQVVGTFDAQLTKRLYLDGALVASGGLGVGIAHSMNVLTIADGVGLGFYAGIADEVAIYPTVLSAARIAAHYAARVKRKVGTRHITRLADSTQQAHRVKVVGNSSSATYEATDWREWNRLQKRLAKESGAPSARILALPDVVDENITTLDEAKRRAWSILANQARRRPYVATVMEPGLAPGMRVDVISAKFGTGSESQPTLRSPLRVSESPSLATGMGRFIVQRVEPELRPGAKDEWQYRVTFGDFQPTLPIALAKATGQGTVPRTAITPKSLTPNELRNRYRRIALPIFGEQSVVSDGNPLILAYAPPAPSTAKWRAWTFRDNNVDRIFIETMLPPDLLMTDRGGDSRFSGSPTGVWLQVIPTFVSLAAGAGGVIYLSIAAATHIPSQGSGQLNVAETAWNESYQIPGTQWTATRNPLMTSGINLAPQGPSDHPAVFLRMVFGRDGTHPFDTLLGEIALVGLELEYLADS